MPSNRWKKKSASAFSPGVLSLHSIALPPRREDYWQCSTLLPCSSFRAISFYVRPDAGDALPAHPINPTDERVSRRADDEDGSEMAALLLNTRCRGGKAEGVSRRAAGDESFWRFFGQGK